MAKVIPHRTDHLGISYENARASLVLSYAEAKELAFALRFALEEGGCDDDRRPVYIGLFRALAFMERGLDKCGNICAKGELCRCLLDANAVADDLVSNLPQGLL
jgi:hypothetical protein